MKRFRVSRLLIALLIGGVLVAGCTPAAAPTPTPRPVEAKTAVPTTIPAVRIGAVWPFSGPLAATAGELRAAAEFAVEVVNNKYDWPLPLADSEGIPSLGGAKIELVFGDTQGSTDVGPAEVERLITQENVVGIIGCYQSSVTKPSSDVSERYGIPHIGAVCSAATLTDRRLNWFWRTGPTDRQGMEAIAKSLADMKGAGLSVHRVAMLIEDSEAGASIREESLKFFVQYGLDIVADVTFPTGATDLTAEILKIKASEPDVLFMQGYIADYVLAPLTMKKLDWSPYMFYGMRGIVTEQVREQLGEDFEWTVAQEVWAPDIAEGRPWVVEVAEEYNRRSGHEFNGESARAFTAMLTWADVINRAGSTDPEALHKALGETQIPGTKTIMPWREIRFDPDYQQNIGLDFLVVQWLNGAWHTIYPFEVASAEYVPMPAWGAR